MSRTLSAFRGLNQKPPLNQPNHFWRLSAAMADIKSPLSSGGAARQIHYFTVLTMTSRLEKLTGRTMVYSSKPGAEILPSLNRRPFTGPAPITSYDSNRWGQASTSCDSPPITAKKNPSSSQLALTAKRQLIRGTVPRLLRG